MKFVFIATHRNIWPVAWLCDAMGVSRSGFHAWLNRSPSARSSSDETVGQQVKVSFSSSDRTYGARRVWRDRSRSDANLIQWWANGGQETLDACGIDDPSDLPAEHLAWMRALPLQVRDEQRSFVHAGVRPGIPSEAQCKDDMLWIREPFLSSRLSDR